MTKKDSEIVEIKTEVLKHFLKEHKRKYIQSHKYGHLTVKQLKDLAKRKGIFVYGDKAQILQCFDQSKHPIKKRMKICGLK